MLTFLIILNILHILHLENQLCCRILIFDFKCKVPLHHLIPVLLEYKRYSKLSVNMRLWIVLLLYDKYCPQISDSIWIGGKLIDLDVNKSEFQLLSLNIMETNLYYRLINLQKCGAGCHFKGSLESQIQIIGYAVYK